MRGVVLADGRTLRAPNVVLATGTFLGGKTFRGDEVRSEGRFGEAPALGLSGALARLGFPLARLKTGTPPRVDRTSLDLRAMADAAPEPGAADLLVREPRARSPARSSRAGSSTRTSARTRWCARTCTARRSTGST